MQHAKDCDKLRVLDDLEGAVTARNPNYEEVVHLRGAISGSMSEGGNALVFSDHWRRTQVDMPCKVSSRWILTRATDSYTWAAKRRLECEAAWDNFTYLVLHLKRYLTVPLTLSSTISGGRIKWSYMSELHVSICISNVRG